MWESMLVTMAACPTAALATPDAGETPILEKGVCARSLFHGHIDEELIQATEPDTAGVNAFDRAIAFFGMAM